MSTITNNKRIVVIQSGWVLAGIWNENPSSIELGNATLIQRWGTTRGLGELALSGPTKESVIHPIGEASVPKSAVLYSIKMTDQASEAWPD
jgi:hypothetical protein